MPIHVAGAQLPVTKDIAANRAAICRAISYAQQVQADILLTPEGSLSGYTHEFPIAAVQEALDYVTCRAREAHLGLALGTCFVESEDGKCYNQLRFYAADGDFLGFHSKTLTCGSLESPSVGEINHYSVRPLRAFPFPGVPIGGLICNDLWANPGCTPMPDPHLSQQLAHKGARVLFHAVNGGRDGSEWSQVNWQYHEANLRMRAAAGRLWIVTVDSCAPLHLSCSAPSGVVAPNGQWVCRVEARGEQYFDYTIDLDQDAEQT